MGILPGMSTTAEIGVNLGSMNDYNPSRMFINAFKTARGFGDHAKPWADYVGPVKDGYPSQPWGTTVGTEGTLTVGPHRFSCRGQCTGIKAVGCKAAVSPLTYDAKTDTTTATIDVTDPDQLHLAFDFTAPASDSQGYAGQSLTDLKLLRPGYDNDDAVYTTDFLAAIDRFTVLRFMDAQQTNGSSQTGWSERPKSSDFSYALRGIPLEDAIYLGNHTGKAIYLNVPHQATDDYVRNFALLLAMSVSEKIKCYVEYSNETWNPQFSQRSWIARWAEDQANANPRDPLSGYDPTLASYTHTNEQAAAYTAKMTAKISKALNYPTDARFRPVLATEIGDTDVGRLMLDYLKTNVAVPAKVVWGFAGAPYFGKYDEFCDRTDLKAADFFGAYSFKSAGKTIKGKNYLMDRAVEAVAYCKDHVMLAKKYGIVSMVYECGVDLGQQDASVAAKAAAQGQAAMGPVIEAYLNGLASIMGGPVLFYNLASIYAKSGYWGLFSSYLNLHNPKFDAAAKVAAALTPAPPPGKLFSVRGVAFVDKNKNGKRENAEAAAGVVVKLWKAAKLVDQKTTDQYGCFLFNNLAAGDYLLAVGSGSQNLTVSADVRADFPVRP